MQGGLAKHTFVLGRQSLQARQLLLNAVRKIVVSALLFAFVRRRSSSGILAFLLTFLAAIFALGLLLLAFFRRSRCGSSRYVRSVVSDHELLRVGCFRNSTIAVWYPQKTSPPRRRVGPRTPPPLSSITRGSLRSSVRGAWLSSLPRLVFGQLRIEEVVNVEVLDSLSPQRY